MILENFDKKLHVAIVGATGGIGQGFIHHFNNSDKVQKIYTFSRSASVLKASKITHQILDLTDEVSIEKAVNSIPEDVNLDIIIVASGVLHGPGFYPEKSLKELDIQKFQDVFSVNCFGPALIMKHFLPRIHKNKKSVFASLSARVGSISDNGIGGWYAYRASKAALNMLIKCTAIEMGRRYKEACIIGLHPGTVDTDLSKPFQGNVPSKKLFTPDYSTEKMLDVINQVTPTQSGKIFDYAGKEIEP
jgi:NAD(P)-dependent dehydrogenase (short-subunit alcohol dehydrogenase family)